MTDEEMAEEYADKNVPTDTFGYRSLDDVHYDVKQTFLAALKVRRSEWHNLNENSNDLPNEGEWVEGLYLWYYKDEPRWDVFKVRWFYEIGELDEKHVRWYGCDEWSIYDRDYWNKVDEPDYWRKVNLPMRNEHDRNY